VTSPKRGVSRATRREAGRLRIAHIGPASDVPILYPFGGAIQRRMIELARQQAKDGHQVTVLSLGSEKKSVEVDGVQVRYLPTRISGPLRTLEFQWRALQSVRFASTARQHVLHFHSQPEGAVLSSLCGAFKVLSYDNFYFRGGRQLPLGPLYTAALNRFERLLPCSQYCSDESTRYWSLEPSRVQVVYNGVNLTQFKPNAVAGEAERRALGLEGRVVLYVGRVCRQKGTHVLLEAFRRVRARRADVTLLVAGPIGQFGNGEDPDGWAAAIAEVGGRYIGPVAEPRLAAIYNLADIYVMPTVELEMFGMAAVEALACGTPVIASDHGGLRETVPIECGGRFPVGDAIGLSAEIEALLGNVDRYRRASECALEHAKRYEWQVICRQLEVIYRDGVADALG
jgi:glycosyltransferase involved in cell wall biosynthesis